MTYARSASEFINLGCAVYNGNGKMRVMRLDGYRNRCCFAQAELESKLSEER